MIALFTIVAFLFASYVTRPKKKLGIGHTIQLKTATGNCVRFGCKESNSVFYSGAHIASAINGTVWMSFDLIL